EQGTRQRAFDHAKLALSLSKAAAEAYKDDHLPFSEIEFIDRGKAIQFESAGKIWKCDLVSYECVRIAETAQPEKHVVDPTKGETTDERQGQNTPSGRRRSRHEPGGEESSPDHKWVAYTKSQNVYVRSIEGKEYPLTQDGNTDNAYGHLEWAPDSQAL